MIYQRGNAWSVKVYHRTTKRNEWVGTFPFDEHGGKRAARHAAEQAEAEAKRRQRERQRLTVGEYADTFLTDYEKRNKSSSANTMKQALRRVKADWGLREFRSVSRLEAKDWARDVPGGIVKVTVQLWNAAMKDELCERNPFSGLAPSSKGRSGMAPPTAAELQKLLDACSVLDKKGGDYSRTFRALLTFAAYTGLRPSEIYALEWSDIDFDQNRITVSKRVYQGTLDLPKSNKAKIVVLTPPARDAVLPLPRDTRYVFTSKRGKRLSQTSLHYCWSQVIATAGLDFDFYLATKHYAVHYMLTELRLSRRAIAAQMGWSLAAVDSLLAVYGHSEVGALDEIDRAFGENVTPLRVAK